MKGVVVNCTPPVIKYPALCAAMLACGGAAYARLRNQSIFRRSHNFENFGFLMKKKFCCISPVKGMYKIDKEKVYKNERMQCKQLENGV